MLHVFAAPHSVLTRGSYISVACPSFSSAAETKSSNLSSIINNNSNHMKWRWSLSAVTLDSGDSSDQWLCCRKQHALSHGVSGTGGVVCLVGLVVCCSHICFEFEQSKQSEAGRLCGASVNQTQTRGQHTLSRVFGLFFFECIFNWTTTLNCCFIVCLWWTRKTLVPSVVWFGPWMTTCVWYWSLRIQGVMQQKSKSGP